MPVNAATTGFPAAAEHSARTRADCVDGEPRAGSRADDDGMDRLAGQRLLQAVPQGRQRPGQAGVEVDVGRRCVPRPARRGSTVRHHLAESAGSC